MWRSGSARFKLRARSGGELGLARHLRMAYEVDRRLGRWTMLTQLFRLLMITHHGFVIEGSRILSWLSQRDLAGFLDWTTDVRRRECVRLPSHPKSKR